MAMVAEPTTNLRLPCWIDEDKCYCGGSIQRFVVAQVFGQEYCIGVPTCQERKTTSPVKDALEHLGRHIGYRIINDKVAEYYIHQYTDLPVGVLEDIPLVAESGFAHRYFLKRDVLRKCSFSPKKPCGQAYRDYRRFEPIGSVYFLLHEATQQLKVGFSKDWNKRVKTHRSSTPGLLSLLGIMSGDQQLERCVHEELRPYRVPGHREWFFYADEVKQYVETILRWWKWSESSNQQLSSK